MQKNQSSTSLRSSTRTVRPTLYRALAAAGLAAGLLMLPASSEPLASVLHAPAAFAAPDEPHEPGGNGHCPPTIQRGSKGAAVGEAQNRLNIITAAWGWKHIDVDRDFGPKTEARVKAFQERMHLDNDGIVGPLTWDKLGACYG
jgi:peptidoglycan hydrolase-like protein with peptidoglycan-binding domain